MWDGLVFFLHSRAARDVWYPFTLPLALDQSINNDYDDSPRHDFSSIVAIELSLYLAKIGEFLTSGSSLSSLTSLDFFFCPLGSSIPVAWRGRFDDYVERQVRERHDLIICSFSLDDLKTSDNRLNLIRNLWNQLLPEGVLVGITKRSL